MILQILLIAVPLVLLVIGIIYLDGKLGLHMTEVPEGSMKFIVAGGDYIRTILNVKGKRMTSDEELIEPGDKPFSISLVRFLGFHWVSWFYPAHHIHKFNLKTNILVSEEEQGQKELKDWVEVKDHLTDRLDLMIRSYFLLKDVELQGQFKVDIVVYALLEIVNPRLAVFMYKGDFVKIFGPAIFSGYVDNVKEFDITAFNDLPKGRGSNFAHKVSDYVNNGGNERTVGPREIELQYGVKLVETYVYEFDQSDKDPVALKAAQAEKVAELEAKATVRKAEGDAQAILTNAQAEAAKISIAVKAFGSAGADPNEAVRAYALTEATRNARNLAVLGGNVLPTIPVDTKRPTTPETT